MKLQSKISIFLLFAAFVTSEMVHAQTHLFLPGNLSRVRALALGGAVMSLEDDLGAISYNPANYTLYRESKSFRVTFFLSPLMPAIIARDRERFFGQPENKDNTAIASALSIFKGINFTISSLDIGLQFGEPKILDLNVYEKQKFLHAQSLYKNQFESLVLRLRLAEQVSVGSSLHLMYSESDTSGRQWSYAASYGVAMQPHRNLRFGISLHTFPNQISSYRMILEEIFDEGINLGVSYQTPWASKIIFDVRNVSVGQDGPREQYFFAVEQEIFHQIALRTGMQYHVEDNSFTFTGGFGLLNLNALYGKSSKFKHSNYALNYAVMYKEIGQEKYFIHAFNFLFRI